MSIRIAVVSNLPILGGGAETAAVRLAYMMLGRGFEPRIYAPRPGPPLYDGVPVRRYLFSPRIPIRLVRAGLRLFGLALALWQDRSKYDIIHVHQARTTAFIGVLVGKLIGKPVIVTVSGGGAPGEVLSMTVNAPPTLEGYVLRLMWRIILKADFFVAKSRQIEQELLSQPIPRDRIRLIFNGVPLYPQVALRPNPLQPAQVFIVAGLFHYKRVDILLRAVATLDDVHLTIVGDGPERPRLETLARQLGIADRVTFAGFVPAAAATCLPQADIFALSSDFEGMPNALLEAMAHGLPCVSTAVGGVLDFVEHEVTGLLVPAGDVEGLGGSLRRLIEDEALRRRLGANARRYIRDHLTLDVMADQYGRLYAEALRPSG